MNKNLSRKEAAEILGVARQSVSNYIKRGLLVQVAVGSRRTVYVTEQSVQDLLKHITDIRSTEDAINEYLTEIKKDEEELAAIHQNAAHEKNNALYLSKIKGISVLNICEMLYGRLPQRESSVLRMLAEGCTYEEIGKQIGLSRTRAQQLITKAIKKIYKRVGSGDDYFSLELRYRRLEREIDNMRRKFPFAFKDLPNKGSILYEPLSSFELSVRCINCCQRAGIETLYDLTKWGEVDLLKFKNFGKRSLDEVKAIMNKYGITFKE